MTVYVAMVHAFTEPFWGEDDGEYALEHRHAAAALGPLMRAMPIAERASALGLVEGFWSLP